MQKSNDNEIVQYLRVKHIINYLEVQVGLTQTLHTEGCLHYCVWGIWSGGSLCSALVCPKRFVYVHAHICQRLHMYGSVCVCVCLSANMHVYMLAYVSGYMVGRLNMSMSSYIVFVYI